MVYYHIQIRYTVLLLPVMFLNVGGLVTSVDYTRYQCTNRLEYRHLLKESGSRYSNCSYIYNNFPACQKEIEISVWHTPPYVDRVNETFVHGLLPGKKFKLSRYYYT